MDGPEPGEDRFRQRDFVAQVLATLLQQDSSLEVYGQRQSTLEALDA